MNEKTNERRAKSGPYLSVWDQLLTAQQQQVVKRNSSATDHNMQNLGHVQDRISKIGLHCIRIGTETHESASSNL